jgi:hypothetical protein
MPTIRKKTTSKSSRFGNHISESKDRTKKYFYCPVEKTRKLKKKTVLEHCEVCDVCFDMMHNERQIHDQTDLWEALGWMDYADDKTVSCESRISAASAEGRCVDEEERELLREHRAKKKSAARARESEDEVRKRAEEFVAFRENFTDVDDLSMNMWRFYPDDELTYDELDVAIAHGEEAYEKLNPIDFIDDGT